MKLTVFASTPKYWYIEQIISFLSVKLSSQQTNQLGKQIVFFFLLGSTKMWTKTHFSMFISRNMSVCFSKTQWKVRQFLEHNDEEYQTTQQFSETELMKFISIATSWTTNSNATPSLASIARCLILFRKLITQFFRYLWIFFVDEFMVFSYCSIETADKIVWNTR